MPEWGNPAARNGGHLAQAGGEPGELKHLSTRRKEKSTRDALSSGERTGRSPNRHPCGAGVVGPADGTIEVSRSPLGWGARDGESPVGEDEAAVLVVFLSSARNEEPGVKLGGPPSKAKDSYVTDSGRVP